MGIHSWEEVRQQVREFRAQQRPLPSIRAGHVLVPPNQPPMVLLLGQDPLSDTRTTTLFIRSLPEREGHESIVCTERETKVKEEEKEREEEEETQHSNSLFPSMMDPLSFPLNLLYGTSPPTHPPPIRDDAFTPPAHTQWRPLLSASWLRRHWRPQSTVSSPAEALAAERRRLPSTHGVSFLQVYAFSQVEYHDPVREKRKAQGEGEGKSDDDEEEGEEEGRERRTEGIGKILFSYAGFHWVMDLADLGSQGACIDPSRTETLGDRWSSRGQSWDGIKKGSPSPHRIPGSGVRVGGKLGGPTGDFLAFCRGPDLWVSDMRGHETCVAPGLVTKGKKGKSILCGSAEYVMQEEFHRFSGFEWEPPLSFPSSSKILRVPDRMRILYGRVDESAVGCIRIFAGSMGKQATRYRPGASNHEAEMGGAVGEAASAEEREEEDNEEEVVEGDEEHRYPRPGSPNAKTDLRIAEIPLARICIFSPPKMMHPCLLQRQGLEGSESPGRRKRKKKEWQVDPERPIRTLGLRPIYAIRRLFPWCEYVVRYGWIPGREAIWAQLLDRPQKHTAWVAFPISCFTSVNDDDDAKGRKKEEEKEDGGMEDEEEMKKDLPMILYEEVHRSWINVTDILAFIPDPINPELSSFSEAPIHLILASERTGFRHLYLISCTIDASSQPLGRVTRRIHPITRGEWPVVDAPIHVDPLAGYVYFLAKPSTPLEASLCRAKYGHLLRDRECLQEGGWERLTPQGWSVSSFSPAIGSTSSLNYSPSQEPQALWFLQASASKEGAHAQVLQIPRVSSWEIHDPSIPLPLSLRSWTILRTFPDTESALPHFFSYLTEDGTRIHGCYYEPEGMIPDERYPTLLHVYGGPKSQVVTNEWGPGRHVRLRMAAKLGFLVVLVDGRGSADRGMAFESWVQGRLGQVEMEDQLGALTWLAQTKGMVDVGRVAVTGWSYGGYLSLMAMTEWSHRFRLAIAGAPVTSWSLYDTAYTERYLGLVDATEVGEDGRSSLSRTYEAASLLDKASQFPDEANRILIVHGLMDENVHFGHTEHLLDALVRAGKPHQLQMYPRERHGIRDPMVNEHFETLMFHWLLNHL